MKKKISQKSFTAMISHDISKYNIFHPRNKKKINYDNINLCGKFGAKIKSDIRLFLFHKSTQCCLLWSQLTMTWLGSVQKRTHHEVDIPTCYVVRLFFFIKWKISSYSYCFSSQIFKIMVYSAKIGSMWLSMLKIPGYIVGRKILTAKEIYLHLF